MSGIKDEVEVNDYVEEDEDWEDEPEFSYELFLHGKQGDDFSFYLEKADSVSEALRMWAESFDYNAVRCRELADRLEDTDIEAYGDTHMICFKGDEEILDKLAKDELIDKVEW